MREGPAVGPYLGLIPLLGIGAALVTEQPIREFGWRWHVLADPDGNEFCVIQPPGSPGPV